MYLRQEEIDDIAAEPSYEERILKAALMYVRNGWLIMPVRPGTKAIPNGFTYELFAADETRVVRWWGRGSKYHGYGISIPTGPNSAVIVDLDRKWPGKDGVKNFEGLTSLATDDLYPRAITPSGGIHLFFDWFKGADTSVAKIAPGIDVRGGRENIHSGHALVWPTMLNGAEYRWERVGEVMAAPMAVSSMVQKVATLQVAVGDTVFSRGNENLYEEDTLTPKEAQKILGEIDPNQLEYDEWIKVGMAIKTYFPDKYGLEMFDRWSQRGDRYDAGECHQRWDGFRDLKEVLGRGRYGCMPGPVPLGCRHRSSSSTVECSTTDTDDKITMLVNEMNASYGVIVLGNKVRLLMHGEDTSNHDQLKAGFSILSKQDFLLYTQHMRMSVPSGRSFKEMLYGDIWLGDPRRKEFRRGLTMAPGMPKEFDGYYNLWKGFSVSPAEGDWSMFKNHILDVVCSGDEYLYNWVLDWMAFGVQAPDRLPGTAIVMRGGEGAGKGSLAKIYGSLFGVHYKHVAHASHLVGNFNAHLADAVVVFADEVIYGGDRRTAGVLKAMVTEPTMVIEGKGIDALPIKNCVHLIVASNEDWVVPAGATARRWLCLDVSNKKSQDTAYFAAIYRQMEQEGGLAAMLYELQRREIQNDLHVAPATRMQEEQKALYSRRNTVAEWWAIQLLYGYLTVNLVDPVRAGDETKWPGQKRVLPTSMYDTYMRWCLDKRYNPDSAYQFYVTMLKNMGVYKVKIQGKNYWRLLSHQEHIQAYEKYMGHGIEPEFSTEESTDENEF